MNTLSGSTRTESPKCRFPAESHVHAVDRCERFPGARVSMVANATTAAAKESATEPAEITPAARREKRLPPSAITTTATSGLNRQIQEVVISVMRDGALLSAQPGQLVDVQRQVPPGHGHDQAESDDDLRRGHGHDGQGEDLPGGS